uniref:Uncharacterized protein n=1 Tax=Calcidiscus leptoporus TaxID=127549 RepID=A0A7S0NUC0_9EUKA
MESSGGVAASDGAEPMLTTAPLPPPDSEFVQQQHALGGSNERRGAVVEAHLGGSSNGGASVEAHLGGDSSGGAAIVAHLSEDNEGVEELQRQLERATRRLKESLRHEEELVQRHEHEIAECDMQAARLREALRGQAKRLMQAESVRWGTNEAQASVEVGPIPEAVGQALVEVQESRSMVGLSMPLLEQMVHLEAPIAEDTEPWPLSLPPSSRAGVVTASPFTAHSGLDELLSKRSTEGSEHTVDWTGDLLDERAKDFLAELGDTVPST